MNGLNNKYDNYDSNQYVLIGALSVHIYIIQKIEFELKDNKMFWKQR